MSKKCCFVKAANHAGTHSHKQREHTYIHMPHVHLVIKCLRTHQYKHKHTNKAEKNTATQSQQRKLRLPLEMALQRSNKHKNKHIYLYVYTYVCMDKYVRTHAFKKQNHISAFVRIYPSEVAVSIGICCWFSWFSKDVCMYVCMQRSSTSCTRELLAELWRHTFVYICNWIRGESFQSWRLWN